MNNTILNLDLSAIEIKGETANLKTNKILGLQYFIFNAGLYVKTHDHYLELPAICKVPTFEQLQDEHFTYPFVNEEFLVPTFIGWIKEGETLDQKIIPPTKVTMNDNCMLSAAYDYNTKIILGNGAVSTKNLFIKVIGNKVLPVGNEWFEDLFESFGVYSWEEINYFEIEQNGKKVQFYKDGTVQFDDLSNPITITCYSKAIPKTFVYYEIVDDTLKISGTPESLPNNAMNVWTQNNLSNTDAPWAGALAPGFAIEILSDITPYSLNSFFANSGSITGLEKIHTEEVIDAKNAFAHFQSTEKYLDLNTFTLGKCRDMASMFTDIYDLGILVIENINTAAVKTASNMFANSNMKYIFVGDNWNLENCVNSANMFGNCPYLPNYDEAVVDKTYAYQFDGLNEGYLRKVYAMISKAYNEYAVLDQYNNQKLSDTSTYLTPPASDEEWLHFDEEYSPCVVTGLKTNLSHGGWNNIAVLPPVISRMLHLCNKASTSDSIFYYTDFSNVVKADELFKDFTGLKQVTAMFSRVPSTKLISCKEMFSGCVALNRISINGWKPEIIEESTDMFKNCTLLPDFDKHPDVIDITYGIYRDGYNEGMLENRTPDSGILYWSFNDDTLFIAGDKLNDKYIQFKRVTESGQQYPEWHSACPASDIKAVEVLTPCTFDNGQLMFSDMSQITTIKHYDNIGFNWETAFSMMGMFQRCTNLDFSTISLSNLSSQYWVHTGSAFASCKWEGPLTLYLNLYNVQNMSGMFGYSNFNYIDFSDALGGMPNLQSCANMFSHCSKLETLKVARYLKELDFDNVPNSSGMFDACTSLNGWSSDNPTDKTMAKLRKDGGYFDQW